jgi:hypothetical protein
VIHPSHRQLVAAGLLALVAGFVLFVGLPRLLRVDPPPPPGHPPLARGDAVGPENAGVEPGALEPRQPLEGDGWRIIEQYSGHWVLIVKVETDRIDDAEAIAREIVEPLKEPYSEALVYFYRPGTTRVLASARVQWTPAGGYQAIDYEGMDPQALRAEHPGARTLARSSTRHEAPHERSQPAATP